MKVITGTVFHIVSDWCADNYLDLNVSKTKEMVVDFRINQNVKDPIQINGTNVDFVDSYKYLGCNIQSDLKWDTHISEQLKKAEKRMYFVRSLRKCHVDRKIICMFYNSVVSSVLCYVISTWFSACSYQEKKDVNKCKRKVCKIVGTDSVNMIEDPLTGCI